MIPNLPSLLSLKFPPVALQGLHFPRGDLSMQVQTDMQHGLHLLLDSNNLAQESQSNGVENKMRHV